MKNLKIFTLTILLLSILQGVNAQEVENANKFILGGSLNFNVQNNSLPLSIYPELTGIVGFFTLEPEDSKNSAFSIKPYFGKEISQRLFMGVQIDYRYSKYEAEDIYVIEVPNSVDYERNSNQIGIGIFTRHTLNPNNQFNLFIEPYFKYNILNEEILYDSKVFQEQQANYFNLGAGLGVMYNINNSLRATLRSGGLSYVNGRWEIKDTDIEKDFSSFRTNLNLSTISFGLEFRL